MIFVTVTEPSITTYNTTNILHHHLLIEIDLTYTVKVTPPGAAKPRLCPPNPPAFLCKKNRKIKKDVLKDVTFYQAPGEMTLLLGAPGNISRIHSLVWLSESLIHEFHFSLVSCNTGSGKTTLFNILANRVKKGKLRGELKANGKKPKAKYYHRDVAYVTQEDIHMRKCVFFLFYTNQQTQPKQTANKTNSYIYL